MSETPETDQVQGEGDYVAGRRFQDAEQTFVKTGPVEQKAREAADALDGPEAEDLEQARRSSAAGAGHDTPADPRASGGDRP
jgi:hypothetical protein